MSQRIALGLIYGNPDQPRKTFDRGELESLAASIKENGLKQPITVRPDSGGRFMIVMGERRFRAHQLLQEAGAGVEDIECQLSDADDAQLAIDAIIENDQRVDVAPLEQARAYQRMLDEFGFDAEGLAKKLGKPLRRITERLDLLRMTAECQKLFESGAITPTQAWWVAQVPAGRQTSFIRAIAAGHCVTNDQLRAFSSALNGADDQAALFELAEPSNADRKAAANFEARLDAIASMLRSSIRDNQVTAVRRVNPDRAATIADLLLAMQSDVKRLETAFRVAAAAGAISQED